MEICSDDFVTLKDKGNKKDFFKKVSHITRKYGRSFFWASYALPAHSRCKAYAIYAMCRILDDLIDESQGPHAQALENHFFQFLWEQKTITETFSEAHGPNPNLFTADIGVFKEWSLQERCLFLFRLRDMIQGMGLERQWVQDLVAGQMSDAHFKQPQTFSDLELYCYRVAGVVGLMMLPVLGAPRHPQTLRAAEALGHAMQITNIARDILEDSLRGRVYFPVEWLGGDLQPLPYGTPEAAQQWARDRAQALRGALNRCVPWALTAYRTAQLGIASLPHWRSRLCVRLMLAIYGAILGKILRDPDAVFRGRTVVSGWHKVLLVLGVLCGVSPMKMAGLKEGTEQELDNDWYNGLGEQWFTQERVEVALLQREGELKNPWVQNLVDHFFHAQPCQVVDLGCGSGSLARLLAQGGHKVTGVDALLGVIETCRAHDPQGLCEYVQAWAHGVPLPSASQDVVCALDLLEHVEEPQKVIAEAARLLRPGGLFVFHTFSKTFVARVCGQWVLNGLARRRVHLARLFMKPQRLTHLCAQHGLVVAQLKGLTPAFRVWPILKLLLGRTLGADFRFRFSQSLSVSYLGYAVLRPQTSAPPFVTLPSSENERI